MPRLDEPPVLEVVASKQGRKHKDEERKVKHKDFEVRLCWAGKGASHPPLTLDEVKSILDLETEPEYRERMLKENPKAKEEKIKFPSHVLVLKGPDGKRFVCWNNTRNRRLHESEATKLAYEFLDSRWAGPHNFPGETVNGSPIRITRTGYVFDGQYRLVAYYFACLIREANPKYMEKWPKGPPPFETVMMLGVSDEKKIFDTTDSGVPRDLADNIYTSDIFRDLGEDQRWECSKYYKAATDFLWKRTGADAQGTGQSYRSYLTLDDFAGRHKKIETCTRWLFDCNNVGETQTHCISLLHLPAGICAGVMYLMGCGDSDCAEYHKGDKEGNRREKPLVWTHLEKAKAFFAELTQPDCGKLQAVKYALSALESEDGATGKLSEKMAVLALAWLFYRDGKDVTPERLDLTPFVKPDSNGKLQLVNPPTFGNLDLGPKPEIEPPEDLEAKARKEREEAARLAAEKHEKEEAAKANGEGTAPADKPKGKKGKAKAEAKPNGEGEPTRKQEEQLADVRKEHPDKVLLFQGSKLVNVWNGDIETVKAVFTEKPIRQGQEGELRVASWPIDRTKEIEIALKEKGHKVGVAMKHKNGGTRVEDR